MAGGYGSNLKLLRFGKRFAFAEYLASLIYPPMPTLNIISKKEIARIKSAVFAKNNLVLNIGAGDGKGSGDGLWKDSTSQVRHIINSDIVQGTNITLITDAHLLPLKSECFDAVVCQAVLEHVPDPQTVVSEAKRVLKKGGFLYIEVPFLQGEHADPHDYQRYTLNGLRVLTKEFNEVTSGVSVGFICVLIWWLRDGLSSLFRSQILYFLVRFIVAWFLSPFRYLDIAFQNTNASKRLASEYYMLAQKPTLSRHSTRQS